MNKSQSPNQLLIALGLMKDVNRPLGPLKHHLLVVHLVAHVCSLMLVVLRSSLVQHCAATLTTCFKGAAVPLLKASQQLLLHHVDLVLCFLVVLLKTLQHGERISVFLLQVLHLAQQNELFLVNDLFSSLSKVIVRLDLVVVESQLALIFLAVNFSFHFVNSLLEIVQLISYSLDLRTTVFGHFSQALNLIVKVLAFFCLFPLNKGFLLVNRSALLLLELNFTGRFLASLDTSTIFNDFVLLLLSIFSLLLEFFKCLWVGL